MTIAVDDHQLFVLNQIVRTWRFATYAYLLCRFIDAEADSSARRNAFLFLFNEAEESAIDFLNTHMERVKDYGDGFSLLVLELCRKVSDTRTLPACL
jgi:hypothetical protein